MKALSKLKAEEGIWMTDVPEPEVGHNDLLIKIRKTAICGTDVHIYNWDEWSQKPSRYRWSLDMNMSAKLLASAVKLKALKSAIAFQAKVISPAGIAVTAAVDVLTCAAIRPVLA